MKIKKTWDDIHPISEKNKLLKNVFSIVHFHLFVVSLLFSTIFIVILLFAIFSGMNKAWLIIFLGFTVLMLTLGVSEYVYNINRKKDNFNDDSEIDSNKIDNADLSILNKKYSKTKDALSRILNGFESAPLAMAILDDNKNIVATNIMFRKAAGKKDIPENFNIKELLPISDSSLTEAQQKESNVLWKELEEELNFTNNKTSYFKIHLRHIKSVTSTSQIILIAMDVTESKRMRDSRLQSQKLESLGRLVGGVAHDFNNIITAIKGYSDLLLQRCHIGDPYHEDIQHIRQNSDRAASLVRQLLAFSRGQPMKMEILDVSEAIDQLADMIRRLIGTDIKLIIRHQPTPKQIYADQHRLEQVIINLAVNARDAMPNGGFLDINTHKKIIHTDQEYLGNYIKAGSYVAITIRDNGHGMDEDTIQKIFDPFFTTKEIGKGTGLGLATVHGLITNMKGYVIVTSQGLGKGCTFEILVPSANVGKFREQEANKVNLLDVTGGESILLVEDEDPVRILSCRALRAKGYQVTEADNGHKAIEYLNIAKTSKDLKFDLLITDMMMPEISGVEVAYAAKEYNPNMPIICMSGYAEDHLFKRLQNEENVRFIAKPFSINDLARESRTAIDETKKKNSV